MNTDDLLPSVYDIYSLGTCVKWVGDASFSTVMNGLEHGKSEGVVVSHNPPSSIPARNGKPIRVRFDSCIPTRALPFVVNVSPRDIMPI